RSGDGRRRARAQGSARGAGHPRFLTPGIARTYHPMVPGERWKSLGTKGLAGILMLLAGATARPLSAETGDAERALYEPAIALAERSGKAFSALALEALARY